MDEVLAEAGIQTVLTALRMPWMSAVMERWVQSCRHELLDRCLLWNERHLRHALREYEGFYNRHRAHQTLAQVAPLRTVPVPITDPERIAGLNCVDGVFGRRRVVQLSYLSAARRLWQDLPMAVRSRDREAVRAATTAVLHVVDVVVATLAEGYADARRDLVRREETLRRELIDDLLRGDSDLGALVERAEPFGLDLARVHQVALAVPSRRLPDADAAISALEPVIFDRLGDRDVLVATKDGLLVVLAPADPALAGRVAPAADPGDGLGRLMHRELSRLPRGRPWRVAVGRAHLGLYGIARSYEEAREALTMASRLHVDAPIGNAHDLLIYRVLLRDQPAIGQAAARVGAHRHLPTEPGQTLTGYNPGPPCSPLHLQAAVLGAKVLNWPEQLRTFSPTSGWTGCGCRSCRRGLLASTTRTRRS
jgi:hypothetical protein